VGISRNNNLVEKKGGIYTTPAKGKGEGGHLHAMIPQKRRGGAKRLSDRQETEVFRGGKGSYPLAGWRKRVFFSYGEKKGDETSAPPCPQ